MRLFGLVLSLVLFTTAARAQPKEPEVRPLSLQDCILIALKHNFDIQIIRYTPEIARYSLSEAYGGYDPVFSASAEHDYNQSPGGVDDEGRTFGGTETETDRFGAGISGLLPWGMTYNLGGTMSDQTGNRPSSLSDTNTFTLGTNTVYDITTGNPIGYLFTTNFGSIATRSPFESSSAEAGVLSVRQPLLKNFWVDSTRYTIYFNKREVQKSEADFSDQLMLTITDVETAYFTLVFTEEQVRVQEKALELADRLLAENKKRVEVGALAPLDEKQAESQVASSKADLLQAKANRDTRQRVLKALLSDNYLTDWAHVVIAPTDKLLAIPQKYDLQESWRRGLARSPRFKLQQLRWSLDQAKRRLRLDRNQVFPQLDLFGNYGFSGSASEYSGALDQVRRQDNPFWAVGAEFSIPLAQTAARNNLKISKATLARSELSLKASEQNALIRIEDDIADAQSLFERVDATREARLYAESALEAEQKKLENGKSTSFIVLELQRDLTAARSAEIQALASYNISLAQLAFDEGSTLDRHRVDLKEVRER